MYIDGSAYTNYIFARTSNAVSSGLPATKQASLSSEIGESGASASHILSICSEVVHGFDDNANV